MQSASILLVKYRQIKQCWLFLAADIFIEVYTAEFGCWVHKRRTSLSSQDPQMTDSYIHQKPIQSSFDRVTIRIFLPHKVARILKHNLQRNLVSDARSAECQHYQEKHLLNVLHSCDEWSEQTSIITLRGAIVVWSSKAEMLTEHVGRDRIRGQLHQRLHCPVSSSMRHSAPCVWSH